MPQLLTWHSALYTCVGEQLLSSGCPADRCLGLLVPAGQPAVVSAALGPGRVFMLLLSAGLYFQTDFCL